MEDVPSTRERILRAAFEVIGSKGLARCTIREIATAAGLSEGALYKHFESKADIFLSMLRHAPTDYIDFMEHLPQRAGHATLEDNLSEFVSKSLEFHLVTLPIAGALFAEPELLAEYQQVLKARNAGPHKAIAMLSRYLKSEQELGRVDPSSDTRAVAAMLAGASFYQSFIDLFQGDSQTEVERERYVRALVRVALKALG